MSAHWGAPSPEPLLPLEPPLLDPLALLGELPLEPPLLDPLPLLEEPLADPLPDPLPVLEEALPPLLDAPELVLDPELEPDPELDPVPTSGTAFSLLVPPSVGGSMSWMPRMLPHAVIKITDETMTTRLHRFVRTVIRSSAGSSRPRGERDALSP